MSDKQALTPEEKVSKMDAAVLALVAAAPSRTILRDLDFAEAYDELSASSRITLYDAIMGGFKWGYEPVEGYRMPVVRVSSNGTVKWTLSFNREGVPQNPPHGIHPDILKDAWAAWESKA